MAEINFTKNRKPIKGQNAQDVTYIDWPIQPNGDHIVTWADEIDWGEFDLRITNSEQTPDECNVKNSYNSFIEALKANFDYLFNLIQNIQPAPVNVTLSSIKWKTTTGSSTAGTAISITTVTNKIIATYSDDSTNEVNETSILVYTNSACTTNASSTWYNTAGTYYIKGIYGGLTTSNSIVWTVNAVTPQYTITFNANGGSSTPSSITRNAGTTISLPSAITRNEDANYTYTFAGWNTNANGSGTNYGAGSNYTVNNNATLYAKWNSTAKQVYYSYVGTDINNLLVNSVNGSLKSDIAEKIKTITGVKTYTTIPVSLESGITIEANQNYVYVIAPTSTLNRATTYLVNSSNMDISTETLGTFNIGSTEYTVKGTPSEVGTIKTAWKISSTIYYSYVGTDLNSLLVDIDTGIFKSDIAEKIKTISGVKTYATIPASLESGITINGNHSYVYVIAPTTTFNNATKYLRNAANMTIAVENLGTFNIGSTQYTVKCTPSEVGIVYTTWE